MGKYDSQIQAMLNQKAAIEFGAEEPSFMLRTGHVQGQRALEKAMMISDSASTSAARHKELLINEHEAIERFYSEVNRKD